MATIDEDVQDEVQQEEEMPTELSLSEDVHPITLKRKDGTPWECELREMSGETRDRFLNTQKRVTNSRTQEITDFKDIQTNLIAFGLYDKETEKLVPREQIQKFPAKTQGALYRALVRLNALNEEAQKKLKKTFGQAS